MTVERTRFNVECKAFEDMVTGDIEEVNALAQEVFGCPLAMRETEIVFFVRDTVEAKMVLLGCLTVENDGGFLRGVCTRAMHRNKATRQASSNASSRTPLL
jgi:hypothetical protein